MSEIATHRLTPAAWARLVVADAFEPTAVRNTTTTTGTGALTLGAAVAGYADIDDVYVEGDVFEGAVTDGVNWEFGYYTLQSGSVVARSRIIASTNDGAAVDFAAGTKTFIANVRSAEDALQLYLAALPGAAGTLTGATLAANVLASSLTSLGTIAALIATLATFTTTIGVGGATPAASGAGITFPATASPSSNVNTLDDYEEGTWTPLLSFTTPGNLSVAYSTLQGLYTKIGTQVIAVLGLVTSTFTHTTASGNCQVSTLPFASIATYVNRGALSCGGITKAGYTNFVSAIAASSSIIEFRASASGSAVSAVTAADMPTTSTVVLNTTVSYTT